MDKQAKDFEKGWEEYKAKQKQIEEMAKVVQRNMCGDRPCEECNYHGFKTEILPRYCETYLIAERLYNAGYRKIPENAVVLTEGEYSDMLSAEVETIKRDIAEYWATEDIEIVAKELHKDGYRKIDDHVILVLRKEKLLEERLRKETAEKFAERLKARYMPTLDEYDEISIGSLFSDIDEIAKELGV